MRPIISTTAALAAIAIVSATVLATDASAGSTPTLSGTGVSAGHTAPPASTCWDQGKDDTAVGIVSQNFEASLDAYDNQGADDFTLSKACKVSEVLLYDTYFNGSGPADSFNITLYKNKRGLPGKVVGTWPDHPYDGGFTTQVQPKPKWKWNKGSYWLSVQANLAFSAGGEWGWNTNSVVQGLSAVWQNPGDGFATGCTTYNTLLTCIPDAGEGGDFAFTIYGK